MEENSIQPQHNPFFDPFPPVLQKTMLPTLSQEERDDLMNWKDLLDNEEKSNLNSVNENFQFWYIFLDIFLGNIP